MKKQYYYLSLLFLILLVISFSNYHYQQKKDQFCLNEDKYSLVGNKKTPTYVIPADEKLDPLFSSYLGGDGDEILNSAPVLPRMKAIIDSQNNLIIVSRTSSPNFTTKNAYQTQLNGLSDAVLVKIAPNGELLFATLLGGSGDDWGVCAAVDQQDNILIGGSTTSNDFPCLNAYQTTYIGQGQFDLDAFFAKFSANGTLLFSSYLGGNDDDWLHAVAYDSSGNPIIVGDTGSTDLPMVNAYQNTHKSSLYNAYLMKFDPSGQSIIFSTYFGGTGQYNWFMDLKIDSQDNIYLTGGTTSNNFPVTLNAYQSQLGGGRDSILTIFSTTGNLTYSSYFGGSQNEFGEAIALDFNNQPVITGHTASANYPTKNAFQVKMSGSQDSFATKFAQNGSLIFSTFIGGDLTEFGWNIVAINDKTWIIGETYSKNFPITENACQDSKHGNYDVYVTLLTASGSLEYSSYFGGRFDDLGRFIAVDHDNNLIIAGFTQSNDFLVKNAYQSLLCGSSDLFVCKFTLSKVISNTTTHQTPAFEYMICVSSIILLKILLSHKKEKTV